MYLTYDSKYWAIDIEGDLIPSTKVWCMAAVNITTGKEVDFQSYEEIKQWIADRKEEGCKFIGHNIIGYDGPTLNRVVGTKLTMSDMIDTMVLSMLFSPSITGGHGLGDWGIRLKFPKGEFNDFSKFTPEMLTYCKRDAQLCRKIYITLASKMSALGFSDVGCDIEHRAWHLIKKQKENGFAFNYNGAAQLYATVRNYENEIKSDIYRYWPPALQIVATYKAAKKKDGSYTKRFLEHREQFVRLEELNEGGYVAWDYVEFNIGSPDQRRDKLLELGWKPEEFTKPSKNFPKGQAQLTRKGKLVPSLERFVEDSGKEEVRLIARWIDVNARGNMINTWMEAYNDKSKCIHGTLWLANTLRYKHSAPNTANIPAVRTDKEGHPLKGRDGVYTYDARDLWTVRSANRSLVGVDAKGIQLRILAHYLNNEAFTEAILSEDPHEANRKNFGLPTRSLAKTITYAVLMGAGDGRISSEAKVTLREAKDVKALFFSQVPELARLIDRLKSELKRTGRITLCSGSKIMVSSDHMVIPYLLQGDESQIMKKAAILTDIDIRRRKLDVLKVGDIHDEWQNDVFTPHVEEFSKIVLPAAFKQSGEFFKYNLPIDCDAKVGKTWAETH